MKTSRQHHGISLIEALIAAVVLSVGLIAIAKLQSDLVTSSGGTKARSEAVALLEREMEQLRSIIVRTDFVRLSDVSTTADCEDLVLEQSLTSVGGYEGTNAVYRLGDCSIETLTALEAVQITLSMEWADPRNVQQTLALSSIVAWDDPMLVARLTTSDGTGSEVSRPSRPGGEGFQLVEDNDRPKDLPTGTGGKTHELFNKGGDPINSGDLANAEYVLLADGSLWKSRGDLGLFKIEGNVFVDKTLKGGNALDPSDIEIISSGDDLFPCLYNQLDTVTKDDYEGFSYVCYKTQDWYGNVGIFYTGGGGNVPRVCVGDPTPGIGTDEIFSRHPQLASVRVYRGYGALATGGFGSTGMGSGEQREYTEQNFLLTRLSGKETCQEKMDHDGHEVFEVNDSDWGNPGFFVCLSGREESDGCPSNLLAAEDVLETTLSGTFRIGENATDLTDTDLTSATLFSSGEIIVENCDVDGAKYSCDILWSGVPFNLRTDTLILELAYGSIPAASCSIQVTAQTDVPETNVESPLSLTITGVGTASTNVIKDVNLVCQ